MSNTRNLADLLDTSGDIKAAALDNVTPTTSASDLTSGTLADARFPATLPTISGENLTGVAPTKATIEALGIAASSITGALPAISGASLTSLPSQTANDFTNTLKTKLDGVEANATADQTNAEIKTAVEAATSIALGGSPTTTTQSVSDNSTKIATTAYTDAQVATVVDSAPGTLNTLNELAAALGDDANFSTTTATNIAAKLPLAGGTTTGDIRMNNKLSFNAAARADTQVYLRNTVVDDRALFVEGDETTAHTASFYNNVSGSGRTGSVVRIHQDGTAAVGAALSVDSDGDITAVFTGGKVGIGTTSPTVTLDVNGTVKATSFSGSGANLTGLTSSFSGLTDTTLSTSDPEPDSNPSATGHFWVNKTSGESYICTDATNNANTWMNIGGGDGNIKGFPGATLMIIGGGGAGGTDLRGGGGAGGMLYFTGYKGSIQYGTQYTITVGSGGSSSSSPGSGGNGGNSTAFGETAGGGEGGGTDNRGGGDSGTSAITTSSSNYTTGNGYSYNGGDNTGNPGAGGAGAGGDGETRPSGNGDGGYGGVGRQISNIYNGSDNYYWAGGGGGPGYQDDGGTGGLGGGGGGGAYAGGGGGAGGSGGGSAINNGDAGNPHNNSDNGGDGGTFTGSGGGGGSHTGGETSTTGGPGGAGIVCIKVPDSDSVATYTGSNVTYTATGGYRYYAFKSSGSITFNI